MMPPTNSDLLHEATNRMDFVSVSAVKDYTRYLYFKHRCQDEKPQTVKMCLFYHKEGGKFPYTGFQHILTYTMVISPST